jgi:hypothetical protein
VPDRTGRHRAPGHGRYASRRPPRHHRTASRTRTGLIATIGGLTVANLVLGGLAVHTSATPSAPLPLPIFSVPPPVATVLGPSAAPRGAERQRAKVRPPVLLGPKNLAASLTAYCLDRVSGATGASPGSDTWECDRVLVRPFPIAMDVACRWLYGPDAWAGMLDDNDQQTWRCYRDPS